MNLIKRKRDSKFQQFFKRTVKPYTKAIYRDQDSTVILLDASSLSSIEEIS